jgi:hypothetical protein
MKDEDDEANPGPYLDKTTILAMGAAFLFVFTIYATFFFLTGMEVGEMFEKRYPERCLAHCSPEEYYKGREE